MYMHRFLYVYIYIYIYVCVCVCVFMYTCLFIYIYMHICICMRIFHACDKKPYRPSPWISFTSFLASMEEQQQLKTFPAWIEKGHVPKTPQLCVYMFFFSENQLSLAMWNKFAHPRPTCSHIKELWKYALLCAFRRLMCKDQRIPKKTTLWVENKPMAVSFFAQSRGQYRRDIFDRTIVDEVSGRVRCAVKLWRLMGQVDFQAYIQSRPKTCDEVFFGTQHC